MAKPPLAGPQPPQEASGQGSCGKGPPLEADTACPLTQTLGLWGDREKRLQKLFPSRRPSWLLPPSPALRSDPAFQSIRSCLKRSAGHTGPSPAGLAAPGTRKPRGGPCPPFRSQERPEGGGRWGADWGGLRPRRLSRRVPAPTLVQ